MKKKATVIVSLILTLAIISSVAAQLGLRAFAQSNGDSGSLKWSLNDDGVFCVNGTGYGDNYTNSVTNRAPWYSQRGSIKKIIVEEGVVGLGDYWFNNCSAATSIELPSTLVKIGAGCFRYCSKVTEITVPENACEYYDNIFYGCSGLKWAVLPSDNTTSSYSHKIPANTFYGCTALENVWVGAQHTAIDANAFRNCSKLSAIVWEGATISSVSTTNYPSGAKIVGNSNVCSWCANNSKSYINIEGSCGNNQTYSYDLTNKKLTVNGSATMSSAPWNAWKYFIYDVDLGDTVSIYDNAFYGCENLTGEMIIPSSVNTIGEGAFNGAGYECYTVTADSISIGTDAFGGYDDLVFYGQHGSGVYDYVQNSRDENTKWRYYCIGNHYFGYSEKCVYCDKTRAARILEECGEHNYVYQHRLGNKLYYKCSECDEQDYCVNARDLLLDFDFAITTDINAYHQSNYDGRFDVYRDGFVNAKDFKLISDMKNGVATAYDMTLTNENATPEAKRLFNYICSVYGNQIISGQQESTWMDNNNPEYEMNYIYNTTGKYPAIRGLDFMNDDFSGVVSRARAWADRGGIVTICWHCSSKFDGSFSESQADELTQEQWDAILTDGTSENAAFLQAMDKAGNALLQLQNEGIPVLWRPFHEFDGGWFWWSKGGSENFKKLWIMMYNHFTYDLGLNNLIWVLGYSHNGTDYGTNLADWYPGSRYCDITGADSYEVSQNGAEARLFNPVYSASNGAKPMVMHETGLIPTVEQFEDVPWGYFMTWHTTYITNDNPTNRLNAIYNSDYVITLDELPDLYN